MSWPPQQRIPNVDGRPLIRSWPPQQHTCLRTQHLRGIGRRDGCHAACRPALAGARLPVGRVDLPRHHGRPGHRDIEVGQRHAKAERGARDILRGRVDDCQLNGGAEADRQRIHRRRQRDRPRLLRERSSRHHQERAEYRPSAASPKRPAYHLLLLQALGHGLGGVAERFAECRIKRRSDLPRSADHRQVARHRLLHEE